MTRKITFATIALAGILIFGLQASLAQEGGMNSNVHKSPKAIPEWVDNNFKWYGEGLIEQTDLLNSMKFLLDNGHMHLSDKAAQEAKAMKKEINDLKQELEEARAAIAIPNLLDARKGANEAAEIPSHTPEWTNPNDADPGMTKSASAINGVHIKDESGKIHGFVLAPSDVDINALIQQVMRESYNENNKDLEFYAEKVKHFNDQKEAIRSHLSDLREYHSEMHGDVEQKAELHHGDDAQKAKMAAVKSTMTKQAMKARTITDASKLSTASHTIFEDIVLKKGGTASAWKEGIAAFEKHGMRESVVDDLQGIVVLCNTEIDKKSQSINAELQMIDEWLALIEEKNEQDTSSADYARAGEPAKDSASYNQSDLDFITRKLSTIDSQINSLDTGIDVLEDKLQTVGDDAQLANIDLQNQLQKQQQTLQTMSKMQKALHDTAMSIIRKMG